MNRPDPPILQVRYQAIAVALGLGLLSAARVSAATIVTLLSSNAQPYLDAEQQVHHAAASRGDETRSVLLADVQNNALKATDMIVAIGSEAAAWAREKAPGDGPLYYCMVPDATALKLDSARRACRGVETNVPLPKQIELISQTLPDARTVGMLYRSDLEQGRAMKAEFEAALPNGWKLEAVAVNEFDSKSKAIDALLERRIDIVWTSPDPHVYDISVLKALLLASLRKSVPVYGFSQAIVKSGGLVGTNINPQAQGKTVADMLIADLEVEKKGGAEPASEARPPPYDIVVNAIVAEKLNITLSQPLLTVATQVYKND